MIFLMITKEVFETDNRHRHKKSCSLKSPDQRRAKRRINNGFEYLHLFLRLKFLVMSLRQFGKQRRIKEALNTWTPKKEIQTTFKLWPQLIAYVDKTPMTKLRAVPKSRREISRNK